MEISTTTHNLTRTSSADQETPGLNQVLPPLSLDETIEQILGGLGWSQLIQAILVSVPALFDAQQTFISIFTDAEPNWQLNTTCNSNSNICKLPKSAWSWDEPSHKTIISEWGLECASSFITGLPASSFFVGSIVGGLSLATLGDIRLGRKNLLYLSCLIMCFTSLFTAFSINIWMYSTLRLLSGFGRGSITTCTLILLTERVGKQWRGQIGTMTFVLYSFGILCLPAAAYLNRGSSWRILYLCTSIPAISYCIITYYFVHESPRWLFMEGRDTEAKAVLRKLASIEGNSLDLDLSSVHLGQEISTSNPYKLMKDLFKRRWALRRILATMVLGFGIGLVYFVGSSREGIQIGLELASFFCTSLALNVLMIFTIELFPTTVRNSASTLVRQAIVLGSVFDPILTSGGKRNGFLSWLFMEGRDIEAKAVLRKLASIEGNSLDLDLSSIHLGQEISTSNPYKLMKDLFKRRWALRRILATMVLGFGIGLVYFARWRRKGSLFALCIISGICSIMCVVVGSSREGIQIGLELASLFCTALALNVLMIFTIELFPTTVRNSASTLVRQATVLGSAFVPILTSGGKRNGFVSFGTFGLTILLCSFIVIILTETKDKNLCNTMDEQEHVNNIIV
nr:organic cation/carnitine transporter 2-like [Quercus suber]